MRILILLAATLVSVLASSANDGWMVGSGGTLQPMGGEHKTIRMVREHVRLTVLPDRDYRVDVEFVFHNTGAPTSVLMGFPEDGGGLDVQPRDYKERSAFKSFVTWVDGRRVSARYVFQRRSDSWYTSHWVKRVRFGRNQSRHVRVRYRSECGVSSNQRVAGYDFTGGNWKGEVEESLMTVTFLVPGRHSVEGDMTYRQPASRGAMTHNRRDNRLFYRWRHWQAEGDFSLIFQPVLKPVAVNFDKREFYSRGDESHFYIEQPDLPAAGVFKAYDHEPALLHCDVTLVAINDLRDLLKAQGGKRSQALPCSIDWAREKNTAWVRAGKHVFGFRLGKAHMSVNGKVHRLASPPLVVDDRKGYQLYVPLAPIIEILGGKVREVKRERRVWFHL